MRSRGQQAANAIVENRNFAIFRKIALPGGLAHHNVTQRGDVGGAVQSKA
jgi:hypothetical protein